MSPLAQRSILAALVGLAALGCERRAPGPTDCEQLAFEVVGVTDPRLLGNARVKAEVDTWTLRCLTTPYDRELVECVHRSERGCYQRFAARHPDRAQRDVLR